MWSARLLAILTIAGIACFTYLACRELCNNRLYPALLTVAWAVMTQGYWTEISHHWFTTLFALVAGWAALRSANAGKSALGEAALAGRAAGAAAMVVPPRGALVMLAGMAAFAASRAWRRQLLAYLLGSLAVPAALFAYVAATGALAAAFDDVVLFPARQYASLNFAPYGYFANLHNYPLLFVFPLAALLALLACLRERRAGDG